jgi:outer membrane biosynthesis protein TonB
MTGYRPLLAKCTWWVAVLCLALLASGCPSKEARTKTVPTVLVPSIETEAPPAPEAETAPAAVVPPAPETAPPKPAETTAQKPAQKPHKTAHKPATPAVAAPPEASKAEPAKAEAPKAETPKADSSTQISADVPRAAAQTQTWNTEQMLRDSESKLASLGRQLNSDEEEMERQARSYISQGRQAVRAGDLVRAYNLAMKANLLANELAK